jgi:acetolactate synthase I/II/III large subunit
MVVACVGDGGFGMTGQELATAIHHGAAPIVLLFNNGMYGTIRMHQERAYPGRVIGTALSNPDFASLAVACGAHGERVERTEAFAPAFERAAKAGRAAVIELRVDPEMISTRTTLTRLRGAAA